jgi:hypothetical protein
MLSVSWKTSWIAPSGSSRGDELRGKGGGELADADAGAASARRANQGSLTAAADADAKKTPLVCVADPPGDEGAALAGAWASIGGGLPIDEGIDGGGGGIAGGGAGGAIAGDGGGGGAVLG